MIKCEVIGNLGADVEVKSSNGSKFATFRVAHSERFKTQDGQETTTTTWVDCTFNNVDSPVLKYLKAGVKVFVRGNAHLRVYSSPKERMMKAGLSVSVVEIELCGGSSDDVPRQVIDPGNGMIYNTCKCFWVNIDTKKMKAKETKVMVDVKGKQYALNKAGFVTPIPVDEQVQDEPSEGEKND